MQHGKLLFTLEIIVEYFNSLWQCIRWLFQDYARGIKLIDASTVSDVAGSLRIDVLIIHLPVLGNVCLFFPAQFIVRNQWAKTPQTCSGFSLPLADPWRSQLSQICLFAFAWQIFMRTVYSFNSSGCLKIPALFLIVAGHMPHGIFPIHQVNGQESTSSTNWSACKFKILSLQISLGLWSLLWFTCMCNLAQLHVQNDRLYAHDWSLPLCMQLVLSLLMNLKASIIAYGKDTQIYTED